MNEHQQALKHLESYLKQIEEAQGEVDEDARKALTRLKHTFTELEHREIARSSTAQQPELDTENLVDVDAAIGNIGDRLDNLQQRISHLDPAAQEIVTGAAGGWLQELTSGGDQKIKIGQESSSIQQDTSKPLNPG